MALIICPECGQKISDKSSTCIHCGCSLEKKKKCPECGSIVNESESLCNICGFPFETQRTTNVVNNKINETNQTNSLLTEKIAVELINYIQFSVAKIVNGKSKGLLEDEFNAVINNINPTSLQAPDLINAYDILLSTLTELKLNENQKDHTLKVIERKKKNAITNCLNSFGSIFVPGANPATLLASVAYTGISAVLNYRRAVNEVEIEGEEEFFEINQNDIEYIDSLRSDLFITTAKVFANKNNSVEGLISENTMKQFAEIVNSLFDNEENAKKVLAFLDAAEHDLLSFPPYWLARAIAEYKSDYDKGKYQNYLQEFYRLNENNPIFKKNPYCIEAAKLDIEISNRKLKKNNGNEKLRKELIGNISKAIQILIDNTQSTQIDLDNLNYDLVQLYIQVGNFEKANKSIEYLENRQLISKNSRLKIQSKLLQNKLMNCDTISLIEKAFCAVEFDFAKYYWIFDKENQSDLKLAFGTPNVKFHISENVINELTVQAVRFSPNGNTNFTIADLCTHNSSLDKNTNYGCIYECSNFTWNDLVKNPFIEIDFGSFTSYYKVSIQKPENWEYFETIDCLGCLDRITDDISLLDSEEIVSEFTTFNAKDGIKLGSKIGAGAILGGVIGIGIGTATAAKDIKKAWNSRGKQKLTWLTISLIGVRKYSGSRIDLIDLNGKILIPDLSE